MKNIVLAVSMTSWVAAAEVQDPSSALQDLGEASGTDVASLERGMDAVGRHGVSGDGREGILNDLLPVLKRGFFESQEAFEQRFTEELRNILQKLFPIPEAVRYSFYWSESAGSEGRPSRSCVTASAGWEHEGYSYRVDAYNHCGKLPIGFGHADIFVNGKAPKTAREFVSRVNTLTHLHIEDAEEGVAAGFVSAGRGSFQKDLSRETNAVCVAFLPGSVCDGPNACRDVSSIYIAIPNRIELKYLTRF